MSESKRDVFEAALDAYAPKGHELDWSGSSVDEFRARYDAAGKIAVPQTVASWIDECKHKQYSLASAFDLLNYPRDSNDDFIRDELVTFGISANAFARAWLDGYTVEANK